MLNSYSKPRENSDNLIAELIEHIFKFYQNHISLVAIGQLKISEHNFKELLPGLDFSTEMLPKLNNEVEMLHSLSEIGKT